MFYLRTKAKSAGKIHTSGIGLFVKSFCVFLKTLIWEQILADERGRGGRRASPFTEKR